MKKILNKKILIGTIIFLCFIFLFVNIPRVYGQIQTNSQTFPQTFIGTPTLTINPVVTATATLTFRQQTDDLLRTYKVVLDSSNSAVEEVHTTANNVLNLVGVMFTLLTIVGIGGTGFFTWFSQRASNRANTAEQKATRAMESIQRTETKMAELEKRHNLAFEATNELVKEQNNIMSQIGAAKKDLQSLTLLQQLVL